MTNLTTKYASADTLSTSRHWRDKDDRERLSLVQKSTAADARFLDAVEIVEATRDGDVITRLQKPLPPHLRGPLLLDLEEHLKSTIDLGLTVWLEPLGDKNSLRNLRGIKVK